MSLFAVRHTCTGHSRTAAGAAAADVRVCVCVFVCVFVCVCVRVCVCVCIYIYIYINICINIYVCSLYTYLSAGTHTCRRRGCSRRTSCSSSTCRRSVCTASGCSVVSWRRTRPSASAPRPPARAIWAHPSHVCPNTVQRAACTMQHDCSMRCSRAFTRTVGAIIRAHIAMFESLACRTSSTSPRCASRCAHSFARETRTRSGPSRSAFLSLEHRVSTPRVPFALASRRSAVARG
jgi:hypothetical protein